MAGKVRSITSRGVSYGVKGSLSDITYKALRCALLHEAEVSDHAVFKHGQLLGMEDDKYIVTDQFLWGLILVLVGEECNASQALKEDRFMTFNGIQIPLNKLWGER